MISLKIQENNSDCYYFCGVATTLLIPRSCHAAGVSSDSGVTAEVAATF